ncbi:MAG: hypothetical protein RL357_1644 [Pseudomonadota bacterium]
MSPSHHLTTAPVLPTLLRMSAPNMLAMFATTLVSVAETIYVGRLGVAPLAGMALVFPIIMLQQMLSAGSMGGGISAAISRALGAQETERADALAWHACCIGFGLGLFFTLMLLGFGTALYAALGGQGAALQAALQYSDVAFSASIAIWMLNVLASIVRASGDMKTPSGTLLVVAVGQIVLGGVLGLGWGPIPSGGMAGVAAGLAWAYGLGALFLAQHLLRQRARVRIDWRAPLRWDLFAPILKVGGLGSLSAIQTVLTIMVVTRIVSGFGTQALAGYGIGSRLEFLMVPITFAVGVACVPLVGMALGAGLVDRARRVAWTGATVVALILGVVGVAVAIWPDLWSARFTDQADVLNHAAQYFRWVGPFYGLFGVGLCLYFASQGAGKLLGPVLAGTLRLVWVAAGGWWLLHSGASVQAMFAVIASGMFLYGTGTAFAVWRTRWQ